MLVGAKEVKDPISGSSYITFDIQGTPEELERVYRKESVEVEIEDDDDTEDFYEPSVEDDYKAFIDECAAEIDDLDADDLFGDEDE